MGWQSCRQTRGDTEEFTRKQAAARVVQHATGFDIDAQAVYKAAKKAYDACLEHSRHWGRAVKRESLRNFLQEEHLFLQIKLLRGSGGSVVCQNIQVAVQIDADKDIIRKLFEANLGLRLGPLGHGRH